MNKTIFDVTTLSFCNKVHVFYVHLKNPLMEDDNINAFYSLLSLSYFLLMFI